MIVESEHHHTKLLDRTRKVAGNSKEERSTKFEKWRVEISFEFRIWFSFEFPASGGSFAFALVFSVFGFFRQRKYRQRFHAQMDAGVAHEVHQVNARVEMFAQ